MSRYLRAFGRETFLLGVNYWSRAGGPRMWARFDEAAVRAEIAQMRAFGANACRSFLFNPTFMPHPPKVEKEALAKLRTFIDACAEAQLAVLPSLLVGHMSGENYDFPGQRGRSCYADEEVVGWERALARAAAGALRGAPAVVAWVLSNEMPLWGGNSDPDAIAAWAKLLADEIRAAAPDVPVGSGDGVMNVRGGQNGFDAERLAQVLDYVGPHAYPADSDPLRQSLYIEYAIRSVQHLGKPVLLEEFGCSSAQAGDAEQAAYWREQILTAMGTGAAGALGWCFSDFALTDEAPYSHHAFELGFGVMRADGSEKPVANVLREAGKLVQRLDWSQVEAPAPRTALLRPSYLETTYPFSWEERNRMIRTQLHAYAAARAAGLQVAVVPETHSLAGFDLILVPATQKLLAPTWERLAKRAQEGATVYWSYFGGDYDFHQGMWCHLFEPLTGCRHRLRYGVPDVPPAEITIRINGTVLRAKTGQGSPFARAFLPVEPVGARISGTDGGGRPAIVQHTIGSGRVVFSCYPLEYYEADVVPLYQRISTPAPFAAADGRVQTHVLHAPGEKIVIATNRSWDTVDTRVDAPGGEGPWSPKEARILKG